MSKSANSRARPPLNSTARFKLPGHASTEDQMIALAMLKQKMETDTKKVKSFSTQAKSQIEGSKKEAQRHHWSREKALQLNERRQAQREATSSLENIFSGTKALASSSIRTESMSYQQQRHFDFAIRTVYTEVNAANSNRVELGHTLMNSVHQLFSRRKEFGSSSSSSSSSSVKVVSSSSGAGTGILKKDSSATTTAAAANKRAFQKSLNELKKVVAQEINNTEKEYEELWAELQEETANIDVDLSRMVMGGGGAGSSSTPVPGGAKATTTTTTTTTTTSSGTHDNNDPSSSSPPGSNPGSPSKQKVTPNDPAGHGNKQHSTRHLELVTHAQLQEMQNQYPVATQDLHVMFRDLILEKLDSGADALQKVIDSIEDVGGPDLSSEEQAAVAALTSGANKKSSGSSSVPSSSSLLERVQEKAVLLLKEYHPNRHPQYTVTQGRQLLYDRMGLEFPNIPHIKLVQVVNSVQQRKQLEGKLTVAEKSINAELRSLFENYASALEADLSWQESERQRLQEIEERNEEHQKMLQKLAQLREKKQEQDAAALQEALEVLELQQQMEEAKQKQLQKEFDQRLEQLERHRVEQLEAQKKAQEEERKRAEVAAIEAEKQMEYNSQRVDQRKQEYDSKLQYRQAQSARRQHEMAAKEERKLQFLAKIEEGLGVQRDVNRMQSHTVSTQSGIEGKYVTMGEEQSLAFGAAKMHGYSTEAIHRDPKFRIQNALVAAGLHTTNYAKAYLKTLAPNNVAAARNATSSDNTLGARFF